MNTITNTKILGKVLVAASCLLIAVPAYSSDIGYASGSYATGDTLTASDLNAKFDEIKTDVNDNNANIVTKQDMVTGTCPLGQSIRVINANGTVACEVDTIGTVDFGTILTVVSVVGTAAQTGVAQADCPASSYATGGSCATVGSTYATDSMPKLDEPVVIGGSPTGWTCACQADTGETCTTTATAICAQ